MANRVRLLLVAAAAATLATTGETFSILPGTTHSAPRRWRAAFCNLRAAAQSKQEPQGGHTTDLHLALRGDHSRREVLRALSLASLGFLPTGSAALAPGISSPNTTVLVVNRPVLICVYVGTTGYMGVSVARELIRKGYSIRGLSRRDDVRENSPVDFAVDWFVGDLTRPESMRGLLAGVDKVVWCIGSGAGGMLGLGGYAAGSEGENRKIFVEAVATIARLAKEEAPGISSYVFLSATGVTTIPGSTAPYPDELAWKAEGEDALRSSGLPYTICRYGVFKPSLTIRKSPGRIDIKQGVNMSDRKLGISVSNIGPVVERCLSDRRCAYKTLYMQDCETACEADWEDQLGSLADDRGVVASPRA